MYPRLGRYCCKYKCANKNIINFASRQATVYYNVGYVTGHLFDELNFHEANYQYPSYKIETDDERW